jgi:phosphoglycolate phosphatase-like HAD superfamily hydrolase
MGMAVDHSRRATSGPSETRAQSAQRSPGHLGDSVWDVEAAKKAGMPAIAVRSGGFGDDELRKAGAIATYDTPGDLCKAADESPLA